MQQNLEANHPHQRLESKNENSGVVLTSCPLSADSCPLIADS
jgi:hypothetical protein